MNHLSVFIFCFLIIYLLYLFVIILRKKGLEKFKTSKQLEYFKIKYKLDVKKINFKQFANLLAMTNAFIIAFTVTIIDLFDNWFLKILVAFVILLPLMYLLYTMLGKHYKKKEGK